ncbi:sigma-70 family RNA polymerase sigma factor [Prolixibacteraceae bacterium JC049]|nr:sigma-70 family RNA polymerase sigma factor [Prolixibacteraceae bacterium JC049]
MDKKPANNKHQLSPAKWVDNYSDMLYSFAYSRVNDDDIAADLVQDTFYSALKNEQQFRGDSSEKTWLYNILRNKIIDHYRKASTQKSSSVDDLSSFFNAGGKWQNHWNESAAPKPWNESADHSVNRSEFYAALNNCLAKLSDKCAAVFNLKNMEDLSSEEICKELNISSSNYWVLMHRAKLQLRACLEKNWFNHSNSK